MKSIPHCYSKAPSLDEHLHETIEVGWADTTLNKELGRYTGQLPVDELIKGGSGNG